MSLFKKKAFIALLFDVKTARSWLIQNISEDLVRTPFQATRMTAKALTERSLVFQGSYFKNELLVRIGQPDEQTADNQRQFRRSPGRVTSFCAAIRLNRTT